ncbi:hypothetical protein [Xenorhabdus khoisanae]|uniref:hypothetical protein n=1 Tax=Xenorhabdus khoisanae TaxID=880157 RepID=UPI00069D5B34|nr:hypothetical protein [Xenorhabdus khoisanae]
MYSEKECKQYTETLTSLIAKADKAITEEDFDFLMDFYTENSSLVVRDGPNVFGKPALHKAFLSITRKQREWLKGVADKAGVTSLCYVLEVDDQVFCKTPEFLAVHALPERRER